MLIKSFFKIVLGLMLFTCISPQSYAEGTPRASIMRAVTKAAVNSGTTLAKGALYIVRNPVVTVDKYAGNVKTAAGAVMSRALASAAAWGYVVKPHQIGGEAEPIYLASAIERAQFLNSDSIEDITADDGQSPGLYLAAWLHGATEAVIYFLQESVFSQHDYPHKDFLADRPLLHEAFHSVTKRPAWVSSMSD